MSCAPKGIVQSKENKIKKISLPTTVPKKDSRDILEFHRRIEFPSSVAHCGEPLNSRIDSSV